MDDWISARDLLAAAFDVHGQNCRHIICSRAHAGMITGFARAVMVTNRQGQTKLADVTLPAGFWWAEGRAALEQDWSAGDFASYFSSYQSSFSATGLARLVHSSSNNNDLKVAAYGVGFDRMGAADLCPAFAPPPEPTGIALSNADERRFFAALVALERKFSEQEARKALGALFPGKTVARARMRDSLKASGLALDGPGRPANSPESNAADK